jgi:DNA-binding MarR family transcriptional regulator
MLAAWGRGVHDTFFATKRAFHGVLAIMRKPLATLGLTPARFDMLYVLYAGVGHSALQSAIRRVLGVTAPTVSRMLRSLEQLGLVKRKRFELDKRDRVVELTEIGLRQMQRAHDALVASGAAQLAVDCALTAPQQHGGPRSERVVRLLDRLLARLRLQFGDTAMLSYRKLPAWLIAGAPGADELGIPIHYRVSWNSHRWADIAPDADDWPD